MTVDLEVKHLGVPRPKGLSRRWYLFLGAACGPYHRRAGRVLRSKFSGRAALPGCRHLSPPEGSLPLRRPCGLSASPPHALAHPGRGHLTSVSPQRVFREHFASFAADYDARYAKELGNFRIERISRVVTRFLARGDYRQGVVRIRCSNPECRLEYFRPFSCRGFHPLGGPLHRLCPSCSQKRSLLFSEHLDEHLLLALLHQQRGFTLPKALRVFLRYNHRLFGRISRLIFSLIGEFYSVASGKPISSAAILAYLPFGDALRFDPHFHALILEGGFDLGCS